MAAAVLAAKVLAGEIQAQSPCIRQSAAIAAKVVKFPFNQPVQNRFFAITVSGAKEMTETIGIIPGQHNPLN